MNSKDYWRNREDEALKNYIKDEKEYDKQIQRIYSDMLDNVQKEINAFYGKYADKENITIAEAKKRVSKMDIAEYERKAKRYVRDKDFSPKANEEMRLYNATMRINRLEMLKANIGLEMIKGHDELDKFMGGILKGRTEEELKRQAGILGKTITNNAKLAHTIPNASFHNATFSDRIWQYQDLMKADLSKLLQTGLIQGKNARVLAKELNKYWYGNDPRTNKGAVYCMERLMRTELARVQTEAQKQSFERNGFEEYEFIANSNCCDVCQSLNGKHFKVAKMMPGENAAPIHPHCRCSTAAYEDSKEYNAWLDHLANGGTTEEWEKIKYKPAVKTPSKAVGVSECVSMEQIDQYMQSKYGIKLSKKAKALDFETVKDATSGVEWVLKQFPELQGYLSKLDSNKYGGVMNTTNLGKTISFSPYAFTGNYYKGNHKFFIETGIHESGHMVEGFLLNRKNASYEETAEMWNNHTTAAELLKEAASSLSNTAWAKEKSRKEMYQSITDYSTSSGEVFAEAFRDVYKNGETASPLSIELMKIIKAKIDKK